MTTRTSVRRVTFFRPFRLAGADGVHAAGSYAVETDEEPLAGLSFAAYRRSATYITLPGPAAGMSQMVRVEPADLDVLLNLKLEGALAHPPGAGPDELSLDALIDDPLIQSAIFSARLTIGEFRHRVDELVRARHGHVAAATPSATPTRT